MSKSPIHSAWEGLESNCLQSDFNTAVAPDVNLTKGRPRLSFTDVSTRAFPLKASMNRLQAFCDNYLNFPDDEGRQKYYFKPAVPFVHLQMINYGRMATESQNLGWLAQNELAFAVLVEWYSVGEDGTHHFKDWGLVCPFIYVDNDMSLSTGREVYGWTKVRAWMDTIPTSWTRDPRRRQCLMNMQTEVLPRLYAGDAPVARTLVEVLQDAPPTISPSLNRYNLFNPLWSIPQAIRGTASTLGSVLEMMGSAPIMGYDRRNIFAMAAMFQKAMGSVAGMAPWLNLERDKSGDRSTKAYLNQITLKQFRDAEEPDLACYQAIVNSRISYDRISDMGMFGAPNMLLGDYSGGLTVQIHEYPEHPVIETLGLHVESRHKDEYGTSVASLKPVMPFWLSCDLRYDTGETLCWRGKENSTDYHQGDQTGTQRSDPRVAGPANRFNSARGAAVQEVPGPYFYPDAFVTFYPMLADTAELQKFCDEYINELGLNESVSGAKGGSGDDAYTVKPWGNYVYLVCTGYGECYGKMWNPTNNVGQLADQEVTFWVPVRIYRGDEFLHTAILTPYIFGSSSRHVISEREINGRPAYHARIDSGEKSWLRSGGPTAQRRVLTRIKTLLIPALNAGQPAEMRCLVDIAQSDLERFDENIVSRRRSLAALVRSWKPELDADRKNKVDQMKSLQQLAGLGSDKDSALEMIKKLADSEPLNFLSLKQYRGTERADKACYQSLVLVEKSLQAIQSIGSIPDLIHVEIHKFPTLPIVERLGLKVKATRSTERGVVDHIQAIQPFYMRVSMKEELGRQLAWRVNSTQWRFQHEAWPKTDKELSGLVESIEEPQAVLETLLWNIARGDRQADKIDPQLFDFHPHSFMEFDQSKIEAFVDQDEIAAAILDDTEPPNPQRQSTPKPKRSPESKKP